MADMIDKKSEDVVAASDHSTKENFGVIEIDLEEERRVLRKIDRVILPLMCVVFFFQCKSWHFKSVTRGLIL
jgi:tRNA A58 N-methylase Trm61